MSLNTFRPPVLSNFNCRSVLFSYFPTEFELFFYNLKLLVPEFQPLNFFSSETVLIKCNKKQKWVHMVSKNFWSAFMKKFSPPAMKCANMSIYSYVFRRRKFIWFHKHYAYFHFIQTYLDSIMRYTHTKCLAVTLPISSHPK